MEEERRSCGIRFTRVRFVARADRGWRIYPMIRFAYYSNVTVSASGLGALPPPPISCCTLPPLFIRIRATDSPQSSPSLPPPPSLSLSPPLTFGWIQPWFWPRVFQPFPLARGEWRLNRHEESTKSSRAVLLKSPKSHRSADSTGESHWPYQETAR